MRKLATIVLGASLLVLLGATSSQATKYPPGPDGPGGACDDSATVFQIQNLTDPCHPTAVSGTTADSVYGVGGIVTGFDRIPTGFAFYIQNNQSGANGAPWTGIDVFTEGTNLSANMGLALGDSVVVSGKLDEFGGGGEIRSFNRSFSSPNGPYVRLVSHGNHVPDFHVGTVTELKQDPTNLDAEQWEGCLVRVNGPLRVARAPLPASVPNVNYLVVNEDDCPEGSLGPCDSLYVDTSTLAGLVAPAVGDTVLFVQGILDQRTTYEIQIRDANDYQSRSAPNLLDAYPVADDTVRLVFDRTLKASSVPTATYVLTSGRPVLSKTLVEPNVIHIAIDTSAPGAGPEAVGDNEEVTVAGLFGDLGGPAMGSQSKQFIDGVLSVAQIQAPDPVALAANPCVDQSRFAGGPGETGQGAPGKRLTFRGIAGAQYGNITYIMDASGGPRSGVAMFAPISPLTVGHKYLIVGAVQEFYSETEATSNAYIRDEGPATIPAPTVEPISVLIDNTCDLNQNLLTAEDFEGCLVKVVDARTTQFNPANSFFVAGPSPTFPDTIDVVRRNNVYSYTSTYGHHVTVTGVSAPFLNTNTGILFRDLYPRSDADIVDLSPAGVDDGLPRQIEFNVYPNPSQVARVSFALPHAADVRISVYDLAGRRVVDIANGRFAAGTYSRDWNGRDSHGNQVGPGVYFYHLKVGNETRIKRAVRLN